MAATKTKSSPPGARGGRRPGGDHGPQGPGARRPSHRARKLGQRLVKGRAAPSTSTALVRYTPPVEPPPPLRARVAD